ncbi:MAG: glycosyltransferase family 9 protein [Bacteroidota bacterium]
MTRKILVIRFSSIGDIILTSPVVRCLHQLPGGVEIHFLTKEKFALIAENNPFIKKVFRIRESVEEVMPLLRKESYNHIIDLHKNLRSRQVIVRLMRPNSSFSKLNLKKWLLVRFKTDLMPPLHIVDRYMKAVESMGVTNDGQGLDFFIPTDQEVEISSLPAPFNKGYIGIVIGGKHNTKILPNDKIVEVCKGLKSPVILLGGPEDANRGEEIAAIPDFPVLNACGKFNLMQSASLVKQARAILTNDTGLMHVAAAFRKPVVSVWGNTIPEFGMYPYPVAESSQIISEVKGLSCRPCSKIGFEKCPKGHFRCMREQDTGTIVRFLNRYT